MRQIPGVKDKRWPLRQGVDLVDKFLQRFSDFRVWVFVKADVCIADLNEREYAGNGVLVALTER